MKTFQQLPSVALTLYNGIQIIVRKEESLEYAQALEPYLGIGGSFE